MDRSRTIYRHLIEQHIVVRLTDAILDRSYFIEIDKTVGDDDIDLKATGSRSVVVNALFRTDSERMYVCDQTGKRLGWFLLVYGNGCHVISNWIGDVCNELVSPVMAFAEDTQSLLDRFPGNYRKLMFTRVTLSTPYKALISTCA